MTFTNRSETVLNQQIIPIYSLGKNPRNSLFSVGELYEGKIPKDVISRLLMAITQIRKNKNFMCVFSVDGLFPVYHLALG